MKTNFTKIILTGFLLFLFSQSTFSQTCQAAFSWDDTNITIQFFDESTTAANDPIVSWFWDFDDNGATSTEQNPTHIFSDVDKYRVELTITTASGCTSLIEIEIEICNFNLNVSVGSCNSNNEVPLIINVIDIYDNADEIDILIDGQVQPGGPYPIDAANPVNVTITIPGDGLQHILTIQSTDIPTCNESFTFVVPDCTSNCFLGSMNVEFTGGATHVVQVGDDFFSPVNTTIVVGDLVTFDWVGDGHSTTSDATTGPDSWNSGVISIGSSFDVSITNPAVHPYYCIPHGGPGGSGMAGSIVANCPPSGNFSLIINFNTTITNAAGYDVLIDGVVQPGSPHTYNGTGAQSVTASLSGDGQTHVIQIRDVADPTCFAERNFLAPDCGSAPSCSISVTAMENGGCNANDEVPVELTVNSINGGANGFNVTVDGVGAGNFTYDPSGVTVVTVNVLGNGQSHNIVVTDVADGTCSGSVSIITTNCTIPCIISNLSASSGNSVTHTVFVEDFVFNPANITITSGDIIEWDWTGQIAHTSTSDATTGADSWDSGLLNTGATYQSPVLSAGVHPYYCIPHGAPGGTGMAGAITVQANCTNGEVSVAVSFTEQGGGFNGFNILVDGVITPNSPFLYDATGNNTASINVIGDGQSHSIEVRDVDDATCTSTINFTTPNCNAPTCNLTMSAVENGSCDANDNVPVDITINDVGGGASGFNILVDGNNVGTFAYSGTGTTNVTINVIGDGQNHNIEVQDIDESTCTTSTSLTTTNCTIPCVLSNLSASTGSSTTHVVGVEDFVFTPANITITAGDIIEWDWTGQIAHTSTSDATSGADSWDSGLLNTGATYQSPILTAGVHPYYCIPHGAPGGTGMAGTITVQANCTNGEVSVNVMFNESGGSFSGYNIYVDGVLTSSSPMSYDPSGNNSFSLNVIGDGNSHSIEIKDVDDPACSILTNITTPNCNAPTCNLTMSAVENGSCDTNNNVPVDITINDVGGGASGFNILVDGNNVGTFAYSGTGTTNVTINVIGDGQNHNIEVQDIDESTCTTSTSLTTTNCTIPCVLSNLNVSTGSSTTHVVGVEDFVFNPANITITAGDIIEWDWTGQIAHTSTSDATNGADSWDSGLLNTGATYQSPILTAGVHPYYCIPHGAPGGTGMAGTITVQANCTNGEVSVNVMFNESGGSFSGYNIYVDGVLTSSSPMSYDPSGNNSFSLNVIGDGNSHSIEIKDVDDPTCSILTNITTPNCNAPTCNLTMSAVENGSCDANDNVPVDITINDVGGGASGFNILVDGNNVGTFAYSGTGTTNVTINVIGDGQNHNIEVQDIDESTCTTSTSLTTTNCTIPCVLSNLSASTGSSTTHVVGVEDFVFNPANITITAGDIIEWDWTGQIAHTSTSDATTGADSWDSGLLNTGATYQSPVLSAGVHPYYCIPHGAPGGTGMAGTITVQANCTNGEVSVNVMFNESGGSFSGYNIYVDGVLTSSSPMSYDPSGNNSFSLNVIGDGNSHSIEIKDVDDPACSILTNITTPNCNAPTCNLTMSAVENGSCDANDNVPVDITINDVGGGASGFNILVDGNNVGTYAYSGTGTTNVTINVIGDGQNHSIEVQDIDESTCTTSTSLTTTNCTIPCVLSNLSASTGSSTTHVVGVEDFIFNPANITITAGDIIEWDWTGAIAHTSTSDATNGADSWDSGLLNTGATYQSPILTAGVHPYYCIPHGAPGGTGMAGTITVQANCTNGEVSVNVMFNESGGSFSGYNIYVDGVLTGNSPMSYDPSGNNSFSLNVIGDGNSHSIEIKDVDDPTCSVLTNITTPNCNAPTCNLTMSAVENGSCDANDNVPVDITINDVGGGASGFNILVDGNNVGTFAYSGTGTTNVTINVIGDGQNHIITVTDIDEATCTASASLTTTNCTIPCVLSNLNVSTGSSTTHVVGVEDFVFTPANITITAGDIIEWDWTGQIAHTSTSDATSGADSWDSGLLNTGATYQSPILTAGVHPYYCIPHGAPGGTGMAGTITVQANCTNGEVSVNVMFNESGGSFSGYNIYVDGVLTSSSPMSYDPSGNNSFSLNVIGDGNSHSIEIKDVDDLACSILTNITTPNCNAPTCNLTMSAVENGSCDANNNVPVDITINDVGGGASGFNILVDGNNVGTFAYSGTGTTNVTINVIGDGQNHNIEVQDIDESTCTTSTSLTTTNCTIPCVLSNLNASTGSSTTHVVGVEDFIFTPANITITAGDIIEWDWTGQIAHTSTSDATTGADSWDSGLLNTGATYQSPVLSAGVHPYYCIPHGAPGGTGMAGTITVQANCTNGEVSVNVMFNESGGSFSGYNIYVDGVLTGNSPMSYDPSGNNSFSLNVIGDGNSHSIEIKDVDDPTCPVLTNITTPNCNAPTCNLTMSALENGSCDANDNVPVDITINDVGGGASGFNILVDGNNVGTFAYSGTGTTNVTINVIGDGQNHNIEVQDIDESTCTTSTSLTTTNCMLNCELSNLTLTNASGANPATHIVEVLDFEFSPKDITISAGDIVRFDWTGVIEHTTTSDATTGNDVWDSGLLNTGATYEVTIQDEGFHPYYCIPHGAVGGIGMAGTITATPPCNNGEVAVSISFDEIGGGNAGYNIFVDGVLNSGSPFVYHPSGNNSLVINIPGDGQSHLIEIEDIEEGTCSISQNIQVPNCNTSNPCSLQMTVTETVSCDSNNEVTYELNINSQNTSSQFNILVDGNIYLGSPFNYDVSGNTIQNISISGTGQNRTITIQDADSLSCDFSVDVLTPLCGPVCEVLNLEVVTDQPAKHLVQVLDFEFFPKDIEIIVGDTVEFVWIGIIPHTATSDALTGNSVFDSGLLGQGATYQVVITESGFHPYYCIPHGGPGGVGMAGTITALEPCVNGEALININFEVTNGSSQGYNVFLDGQQIAGSFPYDDPTGMNTLLLPIVGDGLQHILTVQDLDVSFCAASVNFVAPVCEVLCEIQNITAQSGNTNIHIVEVDDFEFIPESIDVKVGETVRFVWIGDIPHTTTSDATFGIDSWDSGLLELGATFDVVVNSEGAHPYFCIPHGGPGGIGMAGVINATALCDSLGNIDVSIEFNTTNGSNQGYNILVDGVLQTGSPFIYDDTLGFNQQTFSIAGDGLNHFITVQDVAMTNCVSTTSIVATDCNAVCEISNPTISFQQPIKHQVQVADFEFVPALLEVMEGDTVEFVWTGAIAHTATSDATTGNTVFESGLLGQGATFQVVMTEEGTHPYYCIPHGAPGGIGMAGMIKVLSPCDNGIVSATLNFESVGTSMGYNIYVDGILEGNSPHAYSPTGNNSLDLTLNGDGNSHSILIEDVDNNNCNNTITFDVPLCPTTCELQLSASPPSGCSSDNEVTYDLTVISQNINPSGFNVFINNNLLLGSPFSYSTNDTTQLTITLPGDAQNYDIAISDVENSSCSDAIVLTTPLCQNFCSIDLTLEQLSSCDNFGNVLFNLTVNSSFGGPSGFNVFLDGNPFTNNPYTYSTTGTNEVTTLISGDGQLHEIIVVDFDDPTCADTIMITTDDCTQECSMEFLSIQQEVPQLHEVEVLDFEFFPKDITIDLGDTVRFFWTGVVPHTVTSDDQVMADAFNSPLLGQGSMFEVVIENPIFISYYCVPHGAPGGVGMAGTIDVLEPIADDTLDMTFSFSGNNLGVQGYDVFIDGVGLPDNSFSYNPVGIHSFMESLEADGQVHTLKIQDVENIDCFIDTTFVMPNSQDECFDFFANFDFSIDQQIFEVSLTDNTTNDPDEWFWTFGDGNSSTLQNPTHTYTQEGDFEICLIATNTVLACVDTICQTVNIGQFVCEPDFTFAIDGLTVQFTDASVTSDPITNWVYNFGNGLQSVGQQNPIFTYDTLGVYTVCMSIEADTCLAEICQEVDLSDACLAFAPAFTYNFSGNEMGIQITDLSTGNPSNWLWGFGDGNTSNEQNPYHVYDTAGTYNLCLLVQDSVNNCNASLCESVVIVPTATHDVSIKNQDLVIFPNPARASNSAWTIKGVLEKDFYQDLDLKIYDVHGRTLLQETIIGQSQLQVDIPKGLAQGIYMLEMRSEGVVYRGKVVVQ